MKKQNVRTLSLIVATFTYLLIGAAVFDVIESEEEQRQNEGLTNLYNQMKLKFNISDEDLNILEEMIPLHQPYKAGKPWKFAGSFYYATTVLTTIGYGHSTPKTTGGKFFTMVYAIVGIPLGLVMFNSIGERLNNLSSIVINKVRKTLKAKQQEATEMDLICVVSTLSAIVATTGAAAFSQYEGWSYFDSIYYCFVTLTTIGFGDYVALQQDDSLEHKPEYVTFALFFIMFGLAIIAASLNLMVLKFMTMNTEDEKRDVQEAIQAAAQNVRLDGDIILQQSDVLHWQAEGAGSMEELRSVCSCNCEACMVNPFQRFMPNRQGQDRANGQNQGFMIEEDEGKVPQRRNSTTVRWYSTDTLRTTATTPYTPGAYSSASEAVSPNPPKRPRGRRSSSRGSQQSQRRSSSRTPQHNCDYNKINVVSNRAETIHDLRKIGYNQNHPPMRLRARRDTHNDIKTKKQLLVTRLDSNYKTTKTPSHSSSTHYSTWWPSRMMRRMLARGSQGGGGSGQPGADEGMSPKRECFVLEELACIEVVPVQDNHFERVSL